MQSVYFPGTEDGAQHRYVLFMYPPVIGQEKEKWMECATGSLL